MRHFASLLMACLVGGCVGQSPAAETVATISYAGETYPVERLATSPEQWRVRTPDGPAICRAATERDCYWSLRAFLLSQENPDLIP